MYCNKGKMRVLMPLLVFTQLRSLLFPVALSRAQEPLKVVLFPLQKWAKALPLSFLSRCPGLTPWLLWLGGREEVKERGRKFINCWREVHLLELETAATIWYTIVGEFPSSLWRWGKNRTFKLLLYLTIKYAYPKPRIFLVTSFIKKVTDHH